MIYEEILKKFTVMTRRGDSAQCTCPCHDDKRASLTVSKGEAGRTVLFCHAGCRTDAVLSAVGLKQADLFADGKPVGSRMPDGAWRQYVEGREKKKIEGIYHYAALDGSYAFTRLRLSGKEFIYGRLNNNRFLYGLGGKRRKQIPAIYGDLDSFRRAIKEDRTVAYCEGEKDVDALRDSGFPAVTCGSSGDWTPSCAPLFRGARLAIFQDNDTPGRKLAEAVAKAATAAGAASVRIVNSMPDTPHGDVSDYLQAHTAAELRVLVESTGDAGEAVRSDSATPDLDRFHLKDAHGRITGVFDFEIFSHIKSRNPMFVLGGIVYLYKDGMFRADSSGAALKTMIRQLIYPAFVKSNTLKRIYDLFVSDAELQATSDDLNAFPSEWIAFRNGFYDPVNRRMVEHGPKYRLIYEVPHEYHPDETPESQGALDDWMAFICPGDDEREMLLEFCGYCLTRDTGQQKFLVLSGAGGSGKSTLIKLIEGMVGGDNVSNISLSELSRRFAAYGLFGRLVNACADLETDALEDASLIKKVTGEDKIMAEKKGQDAFPFRSYAKLAFSTNQLPVIRGERTNAFYRRLLVLQMNRVPPIKKTDLFETLAKETDRFIHMCVTALERMYQRGTIVEAASSRDAVTQLRCRSDSTMAFLSERCERGGWREERGTLFRAYEDYCADEGRQALSRNGFFESLRLKGFPELKSGGTRYFKGLRICPKTALETALGGGDDEIPF